MRAEEKVLESKMKLQNFKMFFRAFNVKIGAYTATHQRGNSQAEDEELLPVQGLRSWLCALVETDRNRSTEMTKRLPLAFSVGLRCLQRRGGGAATGAFDGS